MKTAAKVHPKTRKTVSGQKHATIQSYHHGDLHDALLKAAETVLERDGVQGLTLRAAAREAGVSHAAPTHHFGDMTGLISELAAVGFRRFAAALTNAANAAASQSAHARLDAMGIAYVTFARTYPGLLAELISEHVEQVPHALLDHHRRRGQRNFTHRNG